MDRQEYIQYIKNGFKHIFDDAENLYKTTGSKLDGFRFARGIYAFCINGGDTDNQALDFASKINNELCEKFKTQPKSLIGYEGNENKYVKLDDLDSKHILQLTFLFNKLNINNFDINNFDRIVEIGGGFGNMCRLCNNIISYNNWDIVDLPHMLELSNYYLHNEIQNTSKINFINAYSDIKYDTIDLVIGTHSVSEFSWDIFYNYFQTIISKSKYFFIGYNKNCPSPELINLKIKFILDNGFKLVDNFDYTEHPYGANVSYGLFYNNNINN
jgi:putative sugar O-methyltransferase